MHARRLGPFTVSGPRYDAGQQREIDTEEFPHAA
jgi:hypothetical protein